MVLKRSLQSQIEKLRNIPTFISTSLVGKIKVPYRAKTPKTEERCVAAGITKFCSDYRVKPIFEMAAARP